MLNERGDSMILELMHFTNKKNIESIRDNGFNFSINKNIPNGEQWTGDGIYFYPQFENGSQNHTAEKIGKTLVQRLSSEKSIEITKINMSVDFSGVYVFDMDDNFYFEKFDLYFKEVISRLKGKKRIETEEKYNKMMEIFQSKVPFSRHRDEFGYFLGYHLDRIIVSIKSVTFEVIAMSFFAGSDEDRKISHPLYGYLGEKPIRQYCIKNQEIIPKCNEWVLKDLIMV